MTESNIKAGFKATGIYPLSPSVAIRKYAFDSRLQISSPNKASLPSSTLCTPQHVLKLRTAIAKCRAETKDLSTPTKTHLEKIYKVADTNWTKLDLATERLHRILTTQESRQSNTSQKRRIIKGKVLLSTEDLRKRLLEAEAETARKKQTPGQPCRRQSQLPLEEEESTSGTTSETEDSDISECIVVQPMKC